MNKVPQIGDHIRTTSDRFKTEWRGKIRRYDNTTGAYLIEWAYCGGLPTDICTWVSPEDIRITRRPKLPKSEF